MKKLVFEYQKYKDRYLPVIKIVLRNGLRELTTEAYVDSGASISAFSSEIAVFLGINYKKGKLIKSLGTAGHIKAYLNKVNLVIDNIDFECRVLFSDELASKFNLIGREGIFDRFKICFDDRNKKLTFEKYK